MLEENVDKLHRRWDWKILKEFSPELNVLVLVWRAKPKRTNYMIARLEILTRLPDDHAPPYKEYSWVTEHNLCYDANPEDRWFAFPHFKQEKEYK